MPCMALDDTDNDRYMQRFWKKEYFEALDAIKQVTSTTDGHWPLRHPVVPRVLVRASPPA